ncbi:hypothetical protein MRB53_037607 [Persea americana]|nr:hypothetical protein MRB53_037607 [Persea americana]
MRRQDYGDGLINRIVRCSSKGWRSTCAGNARRRCGVCSNAEYGQAVRRTSCFAQGTSHRTQNVGMRMATAAWCFVSLLMLAVLDLVLAPTMMICVVANADFRQKAAKATAKRNSYVLKRTHLISLGVNLVFLVLRGLLFRRSFSRASLLKWTLFSIPAFAIEFLFERNSRPTYDASGEQLKRSGDDLEAKGVTEWMWDVLYWTWSAVPVYSAWLAYTTFGSVKQSLGGLAGTTDVAQGGQAAGRRQQKLEKRGGQRVAVR